MADEEKYGLKDFGRDSAAVVGMIVKYLTRPNREAGTGDQSTEDALRKITGSRARPTIPPLELSQPDYGGASPHVKYPFPSYPRLPISRSGSPFDSSHEGQ